MRRRGAPSRCPLCRASHARPRQCASVAMRRSSSIQRSAASRAPSCRSLQVRQRNFHSAGSPCATTYLPTTVAASGTPRGVEFTMGACQCPAWSVARLVSVGRLSGREGVVVAPVLGDWLRTALERLERRRTSCSFCSSSLRREAVGVDTYPP